MKNYTETTAARTTTSAEHLDFDEIVEYVSLNTLDEDALRLASRVDTHVRECDECLQLVNAVELINDEFIRLGNDREFFEKKAPVMDEELQQMLADVRALKREQGMKRKLKKLCYELYKIDWKRSHLITSEREMDSVREYYEGLINNDTDDTYNEYLEERGYSGELYACYEEFLDAEYRDEEYICRLLDDEALIAAYRKDISES